MASQVVVKKRPSGPSSSSVRSGYSQQLSQSTTAKKAKHAPSQSSSVTRTKPAVKQKSAASLVSALTQTYRTLQSDLKKLKIEYEAQVG